MFSKERANNIMGNILFINIINFFHFSLFSPSLSIFLLLFFLTSTFPTSLNTTERNIQSLRMVSTNVHSKKNMYIIFVIEIKVFIWGRVTQWYR